MTKPIKAMLSNIRKYHLLLSSRYAELAAMPSQRPENARILLFLSVREVQQAQLLDKQLQTSRLHPSNYERVLESWIKERPEEPGTQLIDRVNEQLPRRQLDKYAILRACRDQHASIEEVYDRLIDLLPTASNREYFESLRRLENYELRNKVQSILTSDII